MAANGYIQVHAFTSKARIPLKDVTILITDQEGATIAMRLTDRSGTITPVAIATPEASASQSPDTGIVPFTSVNIYAQLSQFEQITAEKYTGISKYCHRSGLRNDSSC